MPSRFEQILDALHALRRNQAQRHDHAHPAARLQQIEAASDAQGVHGTAALTAEALRGVGYLAQLQVWRVAQNDVITATRERRAGGVSPWCLSHRGLTPPA